MKNVPIDFFRIYFEDPQYAGPPFQELLATTAALPPVERTVNTNHGWLHLAGVRPSGRRGAMCGVMLRVKADEIPPAADIAGQLEDLRIKDTQGLAGLTHFYYRPNNRIFLTLRSAGGLGAPSIEHYVKEKTGVDVELRPVPMPEILKKLHKMRELKGIDLELADPDALQHFRKGRSIASLVDIMAEYDAPVIRLGLKVGRARGAKLNRSKVITLAEQLARLADKGEGGVRVAKVRGYDPEEERTLLLDLLKGRMIEHAEVTLGENRRLAEAACVGALEKAYIARSEELEEMYGSD